LVEWLIFENRRNVMSRFYGTLQGSRGQATRCGHKTSGMEVYGASYEGAVRTYLYYDEETDTDMARVELTTWQGSGTNRVLYDGPVGG
jgi:hypothetical protein